MRLSMRTSGYIGLRPHSRTGGARSARVVVALSKRHRGFRLEEEWRKPRRDVRERQHVRMELDPEDVRHEPPPRFDPPPGRGVTRGEHASQRLVGDRDAVL